MKKTLSLIAIALTCVLALAIICNSLVLSNASGKIFDDITDIPHNRVGLLLGTSPITPRGTHNYYFDYRINAAEELLKAGKIDKIIVSGGDYRANEEFGCDEPAAMRDSLINRGINPNRIALDYDGTRTIKSFYNAKNLYQLDSLTIISQKYHNSRALYIAKHFDIKATAFNAKEPDFKTQKLKNHLREYLARVKLFLDLAAD
ncbi:MAG: YdcF family protein [Muribaculaceae bacterium]|nr:YdcF family protein [Muribaculaceae bacterium]